MADSLTNLTFWPALLQQFSQEVLTDTAFTEGNLSQFVSAEQKLSGWLGAPGASESTLQQLEQRLGVALPPSYRAFLAASDGFGPIDYFIWELCSSKQVGWLINTDREVVETWEQHGEPVPMPALPEEGYFPYDAAATPEYREVFLRGCLIISAWGDAGFLALNPAVQHNGEWEAWHFANWNPGVEHFRSFAELMQSTLESYQELKRHKE